MFRLFVVSSVQPLTLHIAEGLRICLKLLLVMDRSHNWSCVVIIINERKERSSYIQLLHRICSILSLWQPQEITCIATEEIDFY